MALCLFVGDKKSLQICAKIFILMEKVKETLNIRYKTQLRIF